MQAGARVKEEGKANNLIELIKADVAFRMKPEEIDDIMDPRNFTGLAEVQTEDFIREVADPVLGKYSDLSMQGEINV